MEKRQRSGLVWALILFIVFVVAIFLYIGRNAVYAQLNDWNLIPKPETFTELYFQNSSNLPRTTVAGEPLPFAFTIHNVEAATTVYPYVVYFEDTNGIRTNFTSGVVTLPNNASTTINVSPVFPVSNLTGEVVVDLPSLNDQSIDFLLSNPNSS